MRKQVLRFALVATSSALLFGWLTVQRTGAAALLPAPAAQPLLSFDMSGGTWWDFDGALQGTGFVWDPFIPGVGTIELVDIFGPPGWNPDEPFVCGRFQPPGIAPNRAMCWELFIPVSGEYRAETNIDGQDFETTFNINHNDFLFPVRVVDLQVDPDQVTFQWTAPGDAQSFMVRVNEVPWPGEATAEIVVPGTQRFATLDVPLEPGGNYQAVVWGFTNDVVSPGPIEEPFNLGSDSIFFTAPTTTRIDGVEFTQVTQELQTLSELKNSLASNGTPPVPIVAGRSVVLRVYMQETDRVNEVTARLSGVASKTETIMVHPGCTPDASRKQLAGCESIDISFVAPNGTWTANLELLDASGNVLEDHEFTVTSVNTRTVGAKPIVLCDAKDPSSGDWLCTRSGRLGELLPFFRSTVPGKVGLRFPSGEVMRETDETDADWFKKILSDINKLWKADGKPGSAYYYGLVRANQPCVKDDDTECYAGLAYRGGHVGMSREVSRAPNMNGIWGDTATEIVAHELGHNLGRRHGPSPAIFGCYAQPDESDDDWPYGSSPFIQEVGYDRASGEVYVPFAFADWMTYCTPRWISPYTYAGAMENLTISGSSPTLEVLAAEIGLYWMLSGELPNGDAIFDPIFELEAVGDSSAGAGEYTIEVRDSSEQVLFARQFDPSVAEVQGIGFDGPPSFVELIPVQSGAASIVVLDSGGELGRAGFAGVAPSVEITFPAGGETISGPATITWEVTDPDSTTHAYWVQYSADGGGTWQTIAPNYTDPELRYDFDRLPGSDPHSLIRVVATDGVNSGTDTSEPFNVPHKRPEADIFFPSDGSIFQGGQLVWLQGAGFDPEDGTLEGGNLQWESDRDGPLGTGDELQLTTLSEGLHEIVLTGTDTDGNSASDSIEILIDETLPDLELFGPPSLTVRACAVVEIDAEDEAGGSGLGSVQYSLDAGSTWSSIPQSELPFEFIVPSTEQVHLVARAIDHAGNLSADERRYYLERECDDADLSVDKGADTDPTIVGEELSYSIWVTNHGPLAATNVQFTDVLPDSVEFVSADPSQGSCEYENGTVSCALEDIAAEDWVTIYIVVRPTRPVALTNTATASSDQIDPDESNNIGSVSTAVDVPINTWPFLKSNLIFLGKDHRVPVAILSSANFDAPAEVDPDSPTFGRIGDEESLDRCLSYPVDANGDGVRDLICVFHSGLAGFEEGDTQGVLRALLNDGSAIEGSDSVLVVPPISSRLFKVRLNGDNEVPPVDTDAHGIGALILSWRGNRLLYIINVDQPMHITSIDLHCGADDSNGPVGVTLYDGRRTGRRAFFGWISAPDDGNACGWTDLGTMITALRSGDTYINVNTQEFPSGEIRGQLDPVRNLWD